MKKQRSGSTIVDDYAERLGEVLKGTFDIKREIGRGAMGRVYLAKDVRHDRMVAVKLLEPHLITGSGALRFLREIQITAALQHPHLLPLLDSGAKGDLVYYVMPVVEGTLRDHLKKEGPMGLEEAVRIVRQVAAALQYAHDHGVVHRDIKPDNILLSAGVAMVSDFGVARSLATKKTHETLMGVTAGTPAYMSPEQLTGKKVDFRTDIHSLGAVLFELLAGRPPFLGDSVASTIQKRLNEPVPLLSAARPGLPVELDAILQRAMASDPKDRFQSAEEFSKVLAPFEARETLTATPLDTPNVHRQVVTPPDGPRPPFLTQNVILLLAGIAAAITIVFITMSGQPRRPSAGDASTRDTTLAALATAPAGMVGAPPLTIDDQDSEAATVGNGLLAAIAEGLGEPLRVLTSAPTESAADDSTAPQSLLVGSVSRQKGDLVVDFSWTSIRKDSVYWREIYHFPDGNPETIRKTVADKVVRALTPRLGRATRSDEQSSAPPGSQRLSLRVLR